MPQLDTLRAFSLFLVLLGHWINTDSWIHKFPIGIAGVTIFFVLSGFLITGILLRNKVSLDSGNHKLLYYLKNFYIRRTIRIFPVYYFTLIVLFILNFENIREIILWFVFYISNYLMYIKMDWTGALSHFWTLAVEEQFYLFWPLIILFTPKKHLFKVIILFILAGIFFRGYNYLINDKTEYHTMFSYMLTLSCIDGFALGAILAYIRNYIDDMFDLLKGKYIFILVGTFLLMIILMFFDINVVDVSMFKFCIAVIALFMVSKLSIGFKGKLKYVFENKFLMYLGKISYGMYIFHTFVPYIYLSLGLPYFDSMLIMFLIYLLILIVISSLSWFVLEKPINNLKNKFSYN